MDIGGINIFFSMKSLTEAKERMGELNTKIRELETEIKRIDEEDDTQIWVHGSPIQMKEVELIKSKAKREGILSMRDAVLGEIEKAESVCFGESGTFNPITKEYIPCTDCISRDSLKARLEEVGK